MVYIRRANNTCTLSAVGKCVNKANPKLFFVSRSFCVIYLRPKHIYMVLLHSTDFTKLHIVAEEV